MSLFKSRFNVLLEQDEEITPPEDTGGAENQNPLQGELQQGTNPEDFGASVKPGDDIASAKQASLDSQKQELTSWIQKVEEFVEYINGVNGDSIQAKLHDASCDTLFEKIASSEHRRLARVAVELSALAEAFKGYLIAGE
jgi:hypothetical protein